MFPFKAPLPPCEKQPIHDHFYTSLFLTSEKKQSSLFLGTVQFCRLAGSNKKNSSLSKENPALKSQIRGTSCTISRPTKTKTSAS